MFPIEFTAVNVEDLVPVVDDESLSLDPVMSNSLKWADALVCCVRKSFPNEKKGVLLPADSERGFATGEPFSLRMISSGLIGRGAG